jgi:asparagine synthetase B (glutamine-hydrolysing)
MPTLAGWLTGEQVAQEVLDQVLSAMGEVLGRHGGRPARTLHPGAGLIAFSDPAYALQRNDDPPVLDWVPDRRTLVYRRPLSGWHPLYYIMNWPAEGNLLFASEIKALFAVGVPRRLNLAALDALRRYGFIPAPWTIFQDIQIVPAGSILRWQRAKTVLNSATDYHFASPSEQLPSLDDLLARFTDASESQLPPHEHLTAITGGESASALSALLASQHTQTPFPVITLGYRKSLEAKIWQRGQQVAQACQRPFLAVTALDQPAFWTATLAELETPCVDTRPLALHQLFHTAAEETGTRVALSGLGAQIVLQGQGRKQTGRLPSTDASALFQMYRQTIVPDQGQKSLWSPDVAQALQAMEPWETTLHAQKLGRRAGQFEDQWQGLYYLDLHLRLPDFAVHQAYQIATQERFALRSPYLHPHLLDTLTRIPTNLKTDTARENIPAALIRRLHVNIDGATETAPLFVPMSSLPQIDGAEILQQTLSPEAIRARGIFDPQAVDLLLQQVKGQSLPRDLLLVFTTQLLCQLFDAQLS